MPLRASPPADTFDTTPVIIGVIRDPVTNAIIFDPTSFDPVSGVLSQSTINAINAAIVDQAACGLALNGVAYVSPGVTHATTVFGGEGDGHLQRLPQQGRRCGSRARRATTSSSSARS